MPPWTGSGTNKYISYKSLIFRNILSNNMLGHQLQVLQACIFNLGTGSSFKTNYLFWRTKIQVVKFYQILSICCVWLQYSGSEWVSLMVSPWRFSPWNLWTFASAWCTLDKFPGCNDHHLWPIRDHIFPWQVPTGAFHGTDQQYHHLFPVEFQQQMSFMITAKNVLI